MPRPSKSEAEIAAYRERVCEAALELFAAKGPENVSMRQIAAKIGASTMLTYRYFRDKDAVLAAVRANAFNRLADTLETATAGPGDARSRATAVSAAYLAFAESNMAAYMLLFEAIQPDAHYPDLDRASARARETMSAYVRRLVEEGFVAGDPILIGNMFWATMHGIIVLGTAGALERGVDAATLRRETFETLFAGLAHRPAGTI